MISQPLLVVLEGVAWARQVDVRLWGTQGGHGLPLLKDWGFAWKKGRKGGRYQALGVRSCVRCHRWGLLMTRGLSTSIPQRTKEAATLLLSGPKCCSQSSTSDSLSIYKPRCKGGQPPRLFFANSFCWSSAFILTLSVRGHRRSGTFSGTLRGGRR